LTKESPKALEVLEEEIKKVKENMEKHSNI